MYVGKQSNYSSDDKYGQEKNRSASIDADLIAIFNALQGRIRFGSGTSGMRGENIGGQWLRLLTSGTSNFEKGYQHTLGSQPMGYIVVSQDKNGSLCGNPLGDTINQAWTSGTCYFRSNGTSGNFVIFLLERGGNG